MMTLYRFSIFMYLLLVPVFVTGCGGRSEVETGAVSELHSLDSSLTLSMTEGFEPVECCSSLEACMREIDAAVGNLSEQINFDMELRDSLTASYSLLRADAQARLDSLHEILLEQADTLTLQLYQPAGPQFEEMRTIEWPRQTGGRVVYSARWVTGGSPQDLNREIEESVRLLSEIQIEQASRGSTSQSTVYWSQETGGIGVNPELRQYEIDPVEFLEARIDSLRELRDRTALIPQQGGR